MWLFKGVLSVAAGISLVSWSKGPGFVLRWGEPLHGMGKLDPGGGLAGRFSTTSSSRTQCWWWGRIWFISLTDSFYKLCQLSALSASILRLPEQTKTSATRGRGCQSRRKLMPPRPPKRVLLAGAHLRYFLSRFCFF